MDVRNRLLAGVLAATAAATIGPADAQTNAQDQPSHPPITVYVQVSDARFDSYLYVKKDVASNSERDGSEEFFFIPRATSKDREKEFADWRRRFNLIVSAATLSDSVQPKIAHVKEEFAKASAAAECWTVDNNRERRITITVIGSASESVIENEYRAASRDFRANPRNFTCKYSYRVDSSKARPSTSEP
jgi:hypothetical protein